MSGAPAGLQPKTPGDLIDQARQAAISAGIDPDIFTRQINQESGFQPTNPDGSPKTSPAGAIGIAQFMPGTAQGLGIDPTNAAQSLVAAAKLDAQNLAKYGGDWAKALAAYNAGGGNVDKYNGVPPFAETQNYVNTILGGAKDLVQQGAQAVTGAAQNAVSTVQNAAQDVVQTGQTAVNTAKDAVQAAAARTSMFAMGLSSGDAMAFCGPAAAMAFAQTYGRNPTVDEAKQLAQQVGWNPSQGMAGPQSEVKLLSAMGIDAHMTSGVDWNSVAQDASSGNPVIVDTPGHYFYVDGYNQQTGQFHLGSSATDLKAAKGQEWFTPDQIPSLGMGDPRAAIFADHPLSPQPSQAAQVSTQASSSGPLYMGTMQPASSTPPPIAQLLNQGSSAVGGAFSALGTGVQDLTSTVQDKAQQVQSAVLNVGGQAGQGAQDLLTQATQGVSQAPQTLNDLLTQNALLSSGVPSIATDATGTAQNAVNTALGLPSAISPLAQSVLQGSQQLPAFLSGLAQTPQVQDLLSNPLAQQVGSQILAPMLGMPSGPSAGTSAINAAASALDPWQTPGVTPLGSLAGNLSQANVPLLSGAAGALQPMLNTGGTLDALKTIQDLSDKYAGTPGSTSIPMPGQAPLSLGVDPSVMTPDDQAAYNQARTAIGGITMPTSPSGISAGDWLSTIIRGGVTGGVQTATDVAGQATIMPLVQTLASLGGDAARLSPGRLQGRVLGTLAGLGDYGSTFLDQLRPSGILAANPNAIIGRAGTLPEQIAAYAAEGLTPTHAAFQQATQKLIQSQELGALGGELGWNQGMRGQQLQQFVQNFIQNPPPDALTAAQGLGARVSGGQQLGTLTGGLGRAVRALPEPLQSTLFPVYQKQMQLGSRLVEMSPFGLGGTAIDVARGLLGQGPYAAGLGSTPASNAVGPLAERLTNNAIGAGLTVLLAKHAADEGDITGSWQGLSPEQQDVLRGQGQIPQGVRIGGQWYPYSKAPMIVQGPLIGAGAYVDAQHAAAEAAAKQMSAGPLAYGVQDPREAAAEQLALEVGSQLLNRSPAPAVADVYNAATGGGGPASLLAAPVDVLSGIAGNLVPESANVRTLAQATDPLERQTLRPQIASQILPAILQNLQQNIPGLREQLPARVDIIGRDIQNPLQGLAAISPFRPAAGQPSPVLAAMAASGVTPSPVPDSIPLGPNLEIKLTPDQQRQYERYRGAILDQAAANLPQNMDPRAEGIALTRISQSADRAARGMLLGNIATSAGGSPLAYANATGVLAPRVGYGPSASDVQQQLLMAQQRQLMASLFGQAPAQSLAAAYPP